MILDRHRPPLQTRGSYLVLLNNASGAEYLCHVLAALPKENEGIVDHWKVGCPGFVSTFLP